MAEVGTVLKAHRWTRPRDLAEALALMAAADPRPVPFAGGTDLMVLLQMRALPPSHFLDLWPLDELRGIQVGGEGVVLGALTTYAEVAEHPHLRAAYPLLVQAAQVSGGWAIQNRGTVGGNIMNASPAADTPPALIAYGARLELASVRGRRWVPYAGFHTGYKRMRRDPDEMLTRIALPPPPAPPAGHFYRKVGPRKAQAISKVCFAGVARWEGDVLARVRIGLASVAPTVLEARETAGYLAGKHRSQIDGAAARAVLDREIAPIDDIRSTAAYRRRVAGNLLEQFLAQTRP
jgi:CO/xanthine dehydrogenase FAD-binding subunit